jgi:dGTPase
MTSDHGGERWSRLLSRKRVSHDGRVREPSQDARSVFERDWDRILFSAAFRRMHDKTQVFPLPDDDVVHSRLTHSLEVASVGRSLGKLVGRALSERHGLESNFEFDVSNVVAAACLAHDIGNPPFGHAGEDAIASFFRSPMGVTALSRLTPRQKLDLQAFEGNAQGFRQLARLQLEADGGLQLTAATLAAFCKYPRDSGSDLAAHDRVSARKHGFFQCDAPIFATVAEETGLFPSNGPERSRCWSRHPLAFLVETADDICYSILDIEDGVRLGLVRTADAETPLRKVATRRRSFSETRLNTYRESKDRIGYLRTIAIGQMIDECRGIFLDAEDAILNADFHRPLADEMPSRDELGQLRALARTCCYRAPEVIEIELAGYEALGGLLEHFVPAAAIDGDGETLPEREQKTLFLLRGRGVDLGGHSSYERLLRITDYVSGMTDRHALGTYRRLKGIAIPGRAGC